MKMEEKKWMTVAQMGELLGLKKTERYWLVHKHFFKTEQIRGKLMVDISSFEKWYANQIRYHKVCGTEPGLELRKRSYSARDISILLAIHEQTAYDLINRTGLKTILVDGWKRVPKKDFDTWFNTQSKYTLHDFSRVTWKENESHSSDPEETASKGMGFSHLDDEEAMSPAADIRQTMTSNRKCPPGYCSRQEAAMLAGVSELTIIHWIEKGHFPQRKVGNKVYIPNEEFSTWMKHREEGERADGIAHYEKREV